jgi:shikimate kinase
MEIIFLIGFMGSGKTTLGNQLAKTLNFKFIDTDQHIEQKNGATVTQLFAEKGEAFFRSEERELLLELKGSDNLIVATGGGLPCFSDNMVLMNEMGITVYLETSEDTLFERLVLEMEDRPLLEGMGEYELKIFIREKLKERLPVYTSAEILLTEKQQNTMELIQRLPQTN